MRAASERNVTATLPAPTRALKVPLVGRRRLALRSQLIGGEFDARRSTSASACTRSVLTATTTAVLVT